MITKTLSLRHDFSEAEINEIAHVLTECVVKKTEVEDEKRSATRQYNGQIKYWEKQIQDNTTLIQDGFEYRDVSCKVLYNTPVAGQKTIERMDTGDKWTEPMTIDEFDLFTAQNVPVDDIDYEEVPVHNEVKQLPWGEDLPGVKKVEEEE